MQCKTGKKCHRTPQGAYTLLRKLKNKGLNAYKCHQCGFWHLGSSNSEWKRQARIDQLLGK